MCESKAVVIINGREEKIMDDVALLEMKNGKVILRDIIGKVLEINYTLVKIDFLKHKIVFVKSKS
ncbi:MAG: RNA-binding protein [Thermoprotei archaeon]|nr:MAG: RNA-binding protein [Thermoprotei archaeon]